MAKIIGKNLGRTVCTFMKTNTNIIIIFAKIVKICHMVPLTFFCKHNKLCKVKLSIYSHNCIKRIFIVTIIFYKYYNQHWNVRNPQ